MFSRRRCWNVQRIGYLSVFSILLLLSAVTAAPPAGQDFSFIQISDIHIEPNPKGEMRSDGRSVKTLEWVCAEAAKPQNQDPYKIMAPVPSFVIATGDITEFGVIGGTFSDFERYCRALPCPMYFTPGNHDNTWTAMLSIMRKKHGSNLYSFDKCGVHFIGLDTASPQEPLPCIDRRALTWLRKDLSKQKKSTPIIVFLHHPLEGTEFAWPYEQLRLADVLRDYNVVLILDGHGHSAVHGVWEGFDRVEGGSTFGANEGYNVISVMDGVLRASYRYVKADRPMLPLLEKPIKASTVKPEITIDSPTADKPLAPDTSAEVRVQVESNSAPIQGAFFNIDNGNEKQQKKLQPVKATEARAAFSTNDLVAGRHFALVTIQYGKDAVVRRAAEFEVASRDGKLNVLRYQHDAGFKAGPVLYKDLVIAGDTAGELIAWDRKLSKPKWTFASKGEILTTPTVDGDRILFSSGDGNVYAVSAATGKQMWKYAATTAVYSHVVVKDGVAYVGDNEGQLHAINVTNGKRVWSIKAGDYSTESGGVIGGDLFYVGNWDGLVYGVAIKDGAVKWKQWGPSGQAGPGTRNRYYAPADCPGVVLGDKLFIADRGYRMGMYQLDGTYIRQLREKCGGISLSEDGKFLYARGTENNLAKLDAEGKVVWEKGIEAGRFPIPPTERNGKVYLCSNRGLLSVLNAADGAVLWQYQVTPRLHVMSEVAVDEQGIAYVTDMDGGLTAVGPKP